MLLATYTVTTPADAGPGSLRQAILDANANPGLDTIRGSVPRSEAVRPLSALPAITDRVSFVSVGLLIVDGSAAGPGSDGLVFEAGAAGSRADRVTVRSFGGSGFRIHAADTTLAGCSVLDNGRGAAPAPGVAVEGGSVVVMGGPVTDPHPTFIGGSGGDGLAVTGGGSATLQRAWIGIGSLGALHLTGNAGHGVSVSDGGALNVESDATYPVAIGGSGGDGVRINPGSRPGVFRYLRIGIAQVNLIRPNSGAGVRIVDSAGHRFELLQADFNRGAGVSIEGPLARDNVFTSNCYASQNGSHGFALLNGASGNTLSGLTLGQNAGSGVFIAGPGTERNVITRSLITSNAAGVTISNADRNSVGDDPFSRNVIHHNRGDGIEVLSGRFNRLAPNDIYSNDGLAIDLGGDGTTPNDPLDADTGANDLQNYPVLTSAVWEGDRLKVSGVIRTRPNTAVRFDLYADPRGGSDPGAVGEEGRYYLGFVEVTTGPVGSADFTANLPASSSIYSASLSPGGYLITATATARPAGAPASDSETSEFSPGVEGPVFARVTGLLANGSAWRPVFREHLAAWQPEVSSTRYGFGLDSDTIVLPLPWVNIDEISIRFSADVHVEQDDLIISGRRVPGYAVRSFRYDPDTLTATWRMARAFAYDRVTLVLDSGDDGVRTVRGNVPLDGESRDGRWPSGDGVPGGDFRTEIEVYRGDVDADRRVTQADLETVRSRLGKTTDDRQDSYVPYSPFIDVNGSGRIDFVDLGYVRASMATQPPVGAEGDPGGITGRFFRPEPSAFSFSA